MVKISRDGLGVRIGKGNSRLNKPVQRRDGSVFGKWLEDSFSCPSSNALLISLT